MTDPRPEKTNPFQWYLGKVFSLQGRSFIVEDFEVQGRDLSFLLRDAASGEVQRIPPIELISGAVPG